MNVLLTQYYEISVLKEKSSEAGGVKVEGEGIEGKVSYSASSGLQITI